MYPEAMNCATCGAELSGDYCAACGEKRFDHHSLSLGHFFEHALEAFIHFDGAIFRTLRTLVARPGRLTADYARGSRKPYLAPVQLFLLMNVLFFATSAATGWTTLNSTLVVHTDWMEYKSLAQRWVKERLAQRAVTFGQYEAVFNAKSATQAKTLVILMVPMLALATAALRFREKRYFAEHLVFSIHFYAFMLLFYSALLSLAKLVLIALTEWRGEPGAEAVDLVLTWAIAAVLGLYLILAMRETGTARWSAAAAQGVLLTAAVMAILVAYKFVLFVVGFYTT